MKKGKDGVQLRENERLVEVEAFAVSKNTYRTLLARCEPQSAGHDPYQEGLFFLRD
jgi:hypothetical protein